MNVECIQLAFYIDWVHFEELLFLLYVFPKDYVPNLCRMHVKKCQNHQKCLFSQKYTQCAQNACIYLYASILHRLGILRFLAFFDNVPNLCRMLSYRYMQAFYTDWVQKDCPHTISTQIGYILKNVPNLCRKLAHNILFQADILQGLPQLKHLDHGEFLADCCEYLHSVHIIFPINEQA